jgi:predicted DNA-binding protein with PD1-like motif
MIFGQGEVHLFRLEEGEDLLQGIVAYCREAGIAQAVVSAIGAVRSPTLGAYDFAQGLYHRFTLEGDWELLALNGNISPAEDVEGPFAHLHILLGGHDGTVRGGHLFSAEVRVAEVVLHVLEGEPLRRERQPNGLLLWPTRGGEG